CGAKGLPRGKTCLRRVFVSDRRGPRRGPGGAAIATADCLSRTSGEVRSAGQRLPFLKRSRYNAFKSRATSAADRPITAGETSHYEGHAGPRPRVAFFCWLAQGAVTRGLSEAPR